MKDLNNQNFFIPLNSLVVGTDKWHLENMVKDNFLWLGLPFNNSSAKGFIEPAQRFQIKTPFPILIDLEECGDIDLLGFNYDNCIFFSENWIQTASKVASVVKNITFFKDYRQFTIKKDYIIQKENKT